MRLSIIVPVYNCACYLRDCLNSLIRQTYKDLQIILVDDGSQDASSRICDDYAKNDRRIQVIHKNNAGVSSARNTGLHFASGEYVLFVDADDWLDQDACEKIVEKLDENKYIYFWNAKIDGKKPTNLCARTSLGELAADIIACNEKYQNVYIRASWAKVYKREFIQSLTFPEQLYIGEDACFLLKCLDGLPDTRQISFINEAWYHYRVSPNSAVRKYKPDLLEQSVLQYKFICSFAADAGIMNDKIIATSIAIFCWQTFIALKSNALKKEDTKNLRNSDCAQWASLTRKHLSNIKISISRFSKLQLACFISYRLLGEKAAEKIAQLYAKYKDRF